MLLPSGNPFKCHEEVLSLRPMIPPKRFDIFSSNWGVLRRSRCVLIFLLNKTMKIKAAVNTLVLRSSFFVTPKYCRLRYKNKIKCGFSVCVNEMPPFGAFLVFIKGCISFYSSGRNGSPFTRGDGKPTRYENVCRREKRTFRRFRVFSCFVWCAITPARICPESCVWVWFAPGSGTGGVCFMSALS